MAAFDSYFTTVDGSRIQNFSSGFSGDLRGVLDDINANFERILSAPFVQGDSGKSVERVTTPLYDNRTTGTFSDFGKAFIKALYNGTIDPDTDNIDTYQDLKDYISNDTDLSVSDITNGVYSCEYINPDENLTDTLVSVDCYMIDPSPDADGPKTFVSLVFYIDLRISELQANSQIFSDNQYFIDRSCVLYGLSDSNLDWDVRRYQIMPTLYWDSYIQQWCWQVNGVESGVTAQGVQGDQGPMIPLWVANGVRYDNASDTNLRSRVYLSNVLNNNQVPNSFATIDDIHDGDVVFVWFKEDSSTTSIPGTIPEPQINEITNFTIGLALKENPNVFVMYKDYYDFRTITDDVVLRTQLNEIGCDYDSSDPANLRGLYVGGAGFRLGASPALSDHIHYFHSTGNNNYDSIHITPTEYRYSYPANQEPQISPGLGEDVSAPSIFDGLFCMDYTGIRSLPKGIHNEDYFYTLDYDGHVQHVIGDLCGPKEIDRFRVTLLQNNEGEYRRPELAFALFIAQAIDEPNEYIFLGGDQGHEYLISRYTYSGTGAEFDTNPAIQIIKEKQNISEESSFDTGETCDRDMWNSLFNYAPSYERNSNASYLNLSYRRHIGLSLPSDQHELSLCFTPKAEVINETTDRKWLRLYLPTVGYMRDATPAPYYKMEEDEDSVDIPNTYFPSKTYTSPNISEGEPNWMEYGGLSIKNAVLDQNANINEDADLYKFYEDSSNDLFLYDRIRFLVDDNYGSDLPIQSFKLGKSAHGLKNSLSDPNSPVTAIGWEESSVIKMISGWKPLPVVLNSEQQNEERYTKAPLKASKYSDYFDILLAGEEPDNSSSWFSKILVDSYSNINLYDSYCYCNIEGCADPNNSWFNFRPILKAKLEKPILVESGSLNNLYLADELYLSCIVAKCINKTSNQGVNISDIEFSLLFIDPDRFNTGANNPVEIDNTRSIIRWSDSNDYKKGNYVALKLYKGRGNYFDHYYRDSSPSSPTWPPYYSMHLFPIRDTIAINFVVTIRWYDDSSREWDIEEIRPSSCTKGGGHAEFSNSLSSINSDFVLDRWIMSDDFIIEGSEGGPTEMGGDITRLGNSNFFESFSWWMLDDLWELDTAAVDYQSKSQYYHHIGLDVNKAISADRFYLSPNSSTDPETPTVWSASSGLIFRELEYNINYTKFYDFYELEMGNTRFGTKPRRREIPSLNTGSFYVKDRNGDEFVKSFRLNYLYTPHEWKSWQVNDNGRVIEENNSRNLSPVELSLITFAMGDAMMGSERSLNVAQNTNNDLNNVVRQLQADDINVSIESVDSSSRQYARNDVH